MSNGEKLENNFEFISYINQIVQVNNFVIPAEIIGIDAKLKYISDNYGLDLKADFDAIKDEQEERILKDPVGLPNEIVVNGEVVNTYDYLVREFPGFVPYVTGDAKSILDSFKTDAQIQAIQQQLQDAGYLKQGAYFPGVLDEVTYQKFNELLKDSNNNGSKWRSFLNKVLTNPKLDLSEIPDKPQLDYNDITNTVISSVKKENFTPEMCYISQLCQLPQVSYNTAKSIQSRYQTMSSIVQALVSNRSETITTVSNLKVKDRRIGQSIAQRLCDYLVPVPKKIIVAKKKV